MFGLLGCLLILLVAAFCSDFIFVFVKIRIKEYEYNLRGDVNNFEILHPAPLIKLTTYLLEKLTEVILLHRNRNNKLRKSKKK